MPALPGSLTGGTDCCTQETPPLVVAYMAAVLDDPFSRLPAAKHVDDDGHTTDPKTRFGTFNGGASTQTEDAAAIELKGRVSAAAKAAQLVTMQNHFRRMLILSRLLG